MKERKRTIAILKKICKKSQRELKRYAGDLLAGVGYDVDSADGYLFATKEGGAPVLLVAHLDTVHSEGVKWVSITGAKLSSPQGIGGDDRAGVFAVLELAKKHGCAVLLTEDEEIGCVGANKFTLSKHVDAVAEGVKFIIELDRRGDRDAVFYDCANDDFTRLILSTGYYKEAIGSYSDISVIAPYIGVAGVNLSIGYYNAHTLGEYIDADAVNRSILEASKLIDKAVKKYEYVPRQLSAREWWKDYRALYEDAPRGEAVDTEYYIEFMDEAYNYKTAIIDATSEDEAVGIFLRKYSTLCYDDIYNIEQGRLWY